VSEFDRGHGPLKDTQVICINKITFRLATFGLSYQVNLKVKKLKCPLYL